jgi:hypothetical protein
MKAQADVNGQVIEIDTEGMEKRITENLEKVVTKQMEQLKLPREDNGKGVVEAFSPDKRKIIVEELRKGEQCNTQLIKEQWTIAIPNMANNELAGHLRDYVFVTDAVKGKPGETVNIPYVKDIDFAHVTVKTGTFTATTGLVNVLTTTLHESGAYYDAYYGDIEKIDAKLLDELNRVFAHAAIRAEDFDLCALIDACTTALMTSLGGNTRVTFGENTNNVLLGDTAAAGSSFQVRWIADGLAKLMQRGKDVRPGECILIMGPKNYGEMLKDLANSTITAFAKGSVITTGMVEDYLGVKIVVCHKPPHHKFTTSSYEQAALIRPKRALALAPKRDILIETDKLIATRQLRITGSHTYGVSRLDNTEIVKFTTGLKAKNY